MFEKRKKKSGVGNTCVALLHRYKVAKVGKVEATHVKVSSESFFGGMIKEIVPVFCEKQLLKRGWTTT